VTPSILRRTLTPEDVLQRGVVVEDLEDLEAEEVEVAPSAPPSKRLRVLAEEKKELRVCPFGLKCYRKNPSHFEEFAHPWLDLDAEPVVGEPASASATEASCHAASRSRMPPLPPPDEPPPALATSPTDAAAATKQLLDMGFSEAFVAEALKHCNTLEAAVNWLLRGGA